MIRNEILSQVITNLESTAVPLASQIDGILAQRIIGIAAVLRSLQDGDDLNTTPPELPEGWGPAAGVADSILADTAYQLGQAATDLASCEAQCREVDEGIALLRDWEATLLGESAHPTPAAD